MPPVSRPFFLRRPDPHIPTINALQAQYSADTLFSRAILLKSALESLADLELRRSYDQKLAHGIEGLKVRPSLEACAQGISLGRGCFRHA